MTAPVSPSSAPGTAAISQDELKAQVGRAALDYVVKGEIVGVGTGSTVNKFIDALATIKDQIKGAVSSSVASTERLPALPNVPTMAETLPGFEAVAWYGIVAPPKTPKNIIDKINADVNEALRQPEVQEQLKKLSAVTFGGPVDKASSYMREEIDRWAAVIKSANIQLQ